ncbi:unnamed protein product [Prorocentrum cordatum]|uniref:Uncharacterized protein n=1 Tax=Prorocentrum cordatum TaxID=2364126 RepID=A0ABN9SRB7_9DINO|nr:unnamed protein product [Polarella glacialis]
MQRRISTGLASFGTLGAFRTAILQNRFGDAEDLLETTEPLTPDDGTTPSAFKSQFHRWWRAVRSPSLSALIVVSLPEASLEAEGESMQSVIRSFQLESAA